ncbi:uncharacterized protein LOC121271536 [Carcharodon carcharias]|uniref:uncharacterized protein LOC121271536 n=1 Tax=Carcharodon carcharias TaxID=13397 RepID=UPI001B7DE45A|nr:uncharacterized protein LOC121271536 [Carcharodon carcharias]
MGTHSLDPGMAENTLCQEEKQSLIVLKNETKLVMEAFLRRMMMFDEAANIGHVGRYYHDSKKFISKTADGQDPNIAVKSHVRRKLNQKGTLEREMEEKKRSLKRTEGTEDNIEWDTTDEEIAQAEEKKHAFRTTIKKLIKRQRKKKSNDDSDKKSKDSLDLLDDHGPGKYGSKVDSKSNSLKRQKSPKPLIACTVGSIDSVTSHAKEDTAEESSKQSSKKSGSQKFFNLFRKQGKTEDSFLEKGQEPEPSTPRPNTLPLMTEQLNNMDIGKNENVEFYSKVAKKLDKLAQQYCAQTVIDRMSPSIEVDAPERVNNNIAQNAMTDKEKMIEKIVLLLQRQGDGINEKIKEDPLLQRTMSRMSYRSFSHLVEVFTANVEEQHKGPTTSPELTKIALTMELTRRVAGISSHPVQQLMGYTMQYMDMFVPWLQENGGWTVVLPLEDESEHQID